MSDRIGAEGFPLPLKKGSVQPSKIMNPGLYSSATDKHNTPKWLVDKIGGFFDEIYLDPCTSAENPVGARSYFTEQDDGLSQEWGGRSVYMNPPYGRSIGDWTGKLVAEYQRGFIDEAIALLPARTDTGWWQGIAPYPVCFIRGRLKFNDCKQSAPFPSALVYLGDNWQEFQKAFGDLGLIYVPVTYLARQW